MPAPSVEVQLDKPRHLRFSLNAICEVEERTGKTMGEIAGLAERGSMSALRYLVWALLLHEDPDLTPEQVGEILTDHMDSMEEISEAIAKAMEGVGGKRT